MRKRIAVLAAQIDETTQHSFLKEFIKQAYVYDYDVCIFSMYQKYQETVLRNIGDSTIFNLINYEMFESVLILIDTILTPGLVIPLQKRIKECFKGPVLVVDQESQFFESVMMDHYSPVKRIVDHLIEVHNYKDIAFLGGKEGHPHSVQRYNAYKDSMKEHNLDIREEWIYHGNYWYDSGERFADILLENRDKLPRAVACANDYMALGLANKLSEKGIKIPEEVAITGYDSVEDGKHSPSPLTSSDIPAGECGKYCMNWLYGKINGMEPQQFELKTPIFIGGSCGCEYNPEIKKDNIRSNWKTHQSSKSVFSDFNHILEDLLSQKTMNGFLNVVNKYSYQISPYSGFDVCLNEGFLEADAFIGENAIRNKYTDMIYRVLSCKDDMPGTIDFERKFPKEKLLPDLFEDRKDPTTYIFNPIYFNDRCFGYTVLSHSNEIHLYHEGYRVWMRNVMQGMEAFLRQNYMFDLVARINAGRIRDEMTGLYNYEGFIKNTKNLLKYQDKNRQMNILALDIKAMKTITEVYGREAGRRAISLVARAIQNSLSENEIGCRMYNDEYIISMLDDENSTKAGRIIDDIQKELSTYKLIENSDYQFQIHYANLLGRPLYSEDLELLVNRSIVVKNHKKSALVQASNNKQQDVTAEIKKHQLVMEILNDNSLTYYYQPIVDAYNGNIFAYEALMRYEKEKLSPVEIIRSASYLNRLEDIEKATLINVTTDVDNHNDLFGDKKVFINSLPGVKLSPEDDKVFSEKMLKNKGKFVIEFTEEFELNDEELEVLKKKFEHLGNHIAIDDYGAGYSNLNNLLRYMPRYIKIDRLLITGINSNPQKQHMVKSIIDYAHNNDIVALAEGVETKEEMKECILLGIDLIQGFYTGKATRVPITEISGNVKREIERYQSDRDWAAIDPWGRG